MKLGLPMMIFAASITVTGDSCGNPVDPVIKLEDSDSVDTGMMPGDTMTIDTAMMDTAVVDTGMMTDTADTADLGIVVVVDWIRVDGSCVGIDPDQITWTGTVPADADVVVTGDGFQTDWSYHTANKIDVNAATPSGMLWQCFEKGDYRVTWLGPSNSWAYYQDLCEDEATVSDLCHDNGDGSWSIAFCVDQDGDVRTDGCEDVVEICDDNVDNDGDGLIDEDDVDDCESVVPCDPNVDADGDGFDACEDCNDGYKFSYPGAPLSGAGWTVCEDGGDLNCNGAVDDTEPECTGIMLEDCGNGLDEDGDGLIDLADGDCVEVEFSLDVDAGVAGAVPQTVTGLRLYATEGTDYSVWYNDVYALAAYNIRHAGAPNYSYDRYDSDVAVIVNAKAGFFIAGFADTHAYTDADGDGDVDFFGDNPLAAEWQHFVPATGAASYGTPYVSIGGIALAGWTCEIVTFYDEDGKSTDYDNVDKAFWCHKE